MKMTGAYDFHCTFLGVDPENGTACRKVIAIRVEVKPWPWTNPERGRNIAKRVAEFEGWRFGDDLAGEWNACSGRHEPDR